MRATRVPIAGLFVPVLRQGLQQGNPHARVQTNQAAPEQRDDHDRHQHENGQVLDKTDGMNCGAFSGSILHDFIDTTATNHRRGLAVWFAGATAPARNSISVAGQAFELGQRN